MKKQLFQLVIGFSLIAAPVALVAQNSEQNYVELYRGKTGMPVPQSIVRPIISTDYVGSEVDLVFYIDEDGRPDRITNRTAAPEELVDSLVDAISRWEFQPLQGEDGEPRRTKVLLPVRVTESRRR